MTPHDGPVVFGLEQYETEYAKNQPQYRSIRTLPGENGNSAIMRYSLTPEQRKAIAGGDDLFLEILHFRGPLAPHRLGIFTPPSEADTGFAAWWKLQTKPVSDGAKAEPAA